MKTVSVMNHKGGVGKTTTTFNLGAELARRGHTVLFVDWDMQGNLSRACNEGRSAESMEHTIADGIDSVIRGETPDYYKIIRRVSNINSNLYIAPCNLSLGETFTALQVQKDIFEEAALRDFLHGLDPDTFEYCLIDCAPSVMLDIRNALLASDAIMIVSSPDGMSESGITSLLRNRARIQRKFEKDIDILGLLINDVDQRTNVDKLMMDQLKANWSEMETFSECIPHRTRVKEGMQIGKTICSYDPGCDACGSYAKLADEFIERSKKYGNK